VLLASFVAAGIAFATAPAASATTCDTSWKTAASGSYTDPTAWTAGVPSGNNGCITLAGTYTVHLQGAPAGATTLTLGGTSGTQTLSTESTCSLNSVLATTSGLTVGANGAVVLTNGDTCGDNATISGPVSNAGTITAALANGGTRTLAGNLTNTGKINVHRATSFNTNATTLTNNGAINIDDGISLSIGSGASFKNGAGGSIVATGASTSGNVFETGGTFTQDAGTTSGTKPVFVDDGTLAYTGTGASAIALRGASALSGNLAFGQSLSIESTCGENAAATAGGSFTSAGSITLTNGDGCGNNATLTTSSGTFTNSGTITTTVATGGQRNLEGNLTNTGTITVHQPTSFNTNLTTLTNNGAIKIDNGVSLSVSGGASVTNGTTGGSITATGSGNVFQTGATFTQGKATITGTKPVFVDDGTLAYTGTGKGLIALRGASTLSGNLSSGQSLSIESTCGEHATTTDAANLTNSGTITLTNGDACGNNATLTINGGGGTLTNKGTLAALEPHGGTRTLSGALTQTPSGKYQAAVNPTAVLNVSGAVTLAGAFVPKPHANKGTVGQTFQVLESPSQSGTFATESGGNVNSVGLYYQPTYQVSPGCAGGFGACVVLTTKLATMTLSATSVAPGGTLTVSGTGWPASDTLTITFTDAHNVKTTYPTVPTDGSGSFSDSIAIPSTASAGTGRVTVTSKLTGALFVKNVTVT
jgi:hypothetical protein